MRKASPSWYYWATDAPGSASTPPRARVLRTRISGTIRLQTTLRCSGRLKMRPKERVEGAWGRDWANTAGGQLCGQSVRRDLNPPLREAADTRTLPESRSPAK